MMLLRKTEGMPLHRLYLSHKFEEETGESPVIWKKP